MQRHKVRSLRTRWHGHTSEDSRLSCVRKPHVTKSTLNESTVTLKRSNLSMLGLGDTIDRSMSKDSMDIDNDEVISSRKRPASQDSESSYKKGLPAKNARKTNGPPSGQRTISSFFQRKDASVSAVKPTPISPNKPFENMSIFASKNDAIVEDKPQSSPLRRALPKSDSDDDRDTVLMKPRKKSKRIIEDEEDEEKHPVPSMEVDIRNTTQSSVESVRKALAPANPLHDATAKAKIRERFLRRFDITNTTEDEDGVNAEDEREEVVLARMQAETKSRKSAKNIKYTPLEQQYLDIKKKHPDCLLVVEVGYKFRFFEEDALTASKVLNIVAYKDKNMYGASIPTQRLNVHAKKLVQLGYKVGIVRQTETAAIKAAGDNKSAPFQRKLTNIYTRGTYMDDLDTEDTLFEVQPSYLMCIYEEPSKDGDDKAIISLLAVQLGTGEIVYDSFVDGALRNELETRMHHLSPAEIILPLEKLSTLTERSIEYWSTRSGPDGEVVRIERLKDAFKNASDARQKLHEFYEAAENNASKASSAIDLFGSILLLPDAVIICLSALRNYLTEFHLEHVLLLSNSFTSFSSVGHMVLSGTAMEQLEIYRAAGQTEDRGAHGSLLWILDHTQTKFGSRLLRKWIGKPLVNAEKLNARVAAVEEVLKLVEDGDVYIKKFRGVLAQLPDLEKALSRVHLGRIPPLELCNFLVALEKASICFVDFGKSICSPLLQEILSELPTVKPICQEYLLQMNEKAAKSGDKRDLFVDEEKYPDITKFKKEIERIKKNLEEILEGVRKELKKSDLQYATVAGVEYLIEVTAKASNKVPSDWVKVNNTKAVSRFHTPEVLEEMRNLEFVREQLSAAAEKAFIKFTEEVSESYEEFKQAIRHIATFDCLMSLARVAGQPGYVKPMIVQEPIIEVTEARHPIVESLMPTYVSNDIHLNSEERCLLITGPNMGGKSSYIRQVALIVIMGQIGSYVPAASAKIGIFDAVFTRMGACDDISKGQSTFMKELSETSDILRQATHRSLVILDELGRGTSTHDGTAIAYATLKYMLTDIKCTTLFVTHYPTLGSLEESFSPLLKCCHMGFMEHENAETGAVITFLYKLTSGLATRSYGLNVAKLASLPDDVIATAKVQSERIEHMDEDHKYESMVRVRKRLFSELWGSPQASDLLDIVHTGP